MRPLTSLIPLAALACAAALAAPAPARAATPDELVSSALDALDAARATYDAARWQCAADLGPALAAAADRLRWMSGGDHALRGTRDALEALADGVDASCQPPLRATLTRQVDRALVRLEVALADPGGRGHSHHGPHGPPQATETSAVDAQCLGTLRDAYPYQPDRDAILEWIGACRSGAPADACAATLSAPDAACVAAASRIYPYMMDAATQAAFVAACTRYECRPPASGVRVDAAVDGACMRQLADAYAYQPSRDVILQWTASCRARPGASCVRASASFDGACFAIATTRYPYQADRATLRAFADACATERYVCP